LTTTTESETREYPFVHFTVQSLFDGVHIRVVCNAASSLPSRQRPARCAQPSDDAGAGCWQLPATDRTMTP
jgi:hypothetical protein